MVWRDKGIEPKREACLNIDTTKRVRKSLTNLEHILVWDIHQCHLLEEAHLSLRDSRDAKRFAFMKHHWALVTPTLTTFQITWRTEQGWKKLDLPDSVYGFMDLFRILVDLAIQQQTQQG